MSRPAPPASFLRREPGSTGRPTNVFGTPRAKVWRDDADPADLAAARFQHQVALLLRNAINLSADAPLTRFTTIHGLSYDRIRDVLAGDQWMRLDEMVTIAEALGLELKLTMPAKAKRRRRSP